MKTIMRNLTGVLLVAAAALGTARPQSATQELRLSDIKAQQPREAVIASAPCPETIRSRRSEDEVNMIRHETKRPHRTQDPLLQMYWLGWLAQTGRPCLQ
jgi:hypothetical protein